MKTSRITEIVMFQPNESASEAELLEKADKLVGGFQKKETGFIDAELVKNVSDNKWCIIYHYQSMADVDAIGKTIRNTEAFKAFAALTLPDSISVSFYQYKLDW